MDGTQLHLDVYLFAIVCYQLLQPLNILLQRLLLPFEVRQTCFQCVESFLLLLHYFRQIGQLFNIFLQLIRIPFRLGEQGKLLKSTYRLFHQLDLVHTIALLELQSVQLPSQSVFLLLRLLHVAPRICDLVTPLINLPINLTIFLLAKFSLADKLGLLCLEGCLLRFKILLLAVQKNILLLCLLQLYSDTFQIILFCELLLNRVITLLGQR